MPKKNTNSNKKDEKKPASSSKQAAKKQGAADKDADVIPVNKLLLPAPSQKVKHKNHVVEEILPGFVWVVHDFLQDTECQAWIDFVTLNKKLDYVQHPATKYVANRECFRWQRNDTQIAETLYQRMQNCGILRELQAKVDFSTDASYAACGCNPNIRLYKYEKGMSFGKHVDGSDVIYGLGQTEVTVLVYLSDCQGGATRFIPIQVGNGIKALRLLQNVAHY